VSSVSFQIKWMPPSRIGVRRAGIDRNWNRYVKSKGAHAQRSVIHVRKMRSHQGTPPLGLCSPKNSARCTGAVSDGSQSRTGFTCWAWSRSTAGALNSFAGYKLRQFLTKTCAAGIEMDPDLPGYFKLFPQGNGRPSRVWSRERA